MPFECGDCCGEGIGAFCYVFWCPCLAIKDSVELVGGPKDPSWVESGSLKNGDAGQLCIIDCFGRFVNIFCLSWYALSNASEIVGDRVGIQDDHCFKSCPLVACFYCHLNAVYNKAVQYDRKKTSSPAGGAIERE